MLLLFFFLDVHMWVLAPRPGIEPAPLALEAEVLTTGPPGRSSIKPFLNQKRTLNFINCLHGSVSHILLIDLLIEG